MSVPPQWALADLDRAWADRSDPKPTLAWRRRRPRKPVWQQRVGRWDRGSAGDYCSGRCYGGEDGGPARIVVTAGTKAPRWQQRALLLHEIAHAMTPDHHHDVTFYTTAWTLFRAFGLPLRKVAAFEDRYRKTSIAGRLATAPG